MALTEEGKQLKHQCIRLKEELDTTRNLIHGFHQSPKGRLAIYCNPFLAKGVFFKLLHQYQQRFPEVEIELYLDEHLPDMANDQIDIVYGVNWPPPEDIVRRQIGKTRYVVCASPTYLSKKGTPKTLEDLKQHDYLAHISRVPNNALIDLRQKPPFILEPILKVKDAAYLKYCAINGLGVVQLHDYVVNDALEQGQLIEILSSYINPHIPLYIYYQKHRYVQPKIRQFVELALTI